MQPGRLLLHRNIQPATQLGQDGPGLSFGYGYFFQRSVEVMAGLIVGGARYSIDCQEFLLTLKCKLEERQL
ncbi:hypothetical protein D3C76_1482820 [compost metagenome]